MRPKTNPMRYAKLLKWFVLTLFCLFNGNSAFGNPNTTILLMGDSLSAEYGLVRGAGWANILQQKLVQQGSSWKVFNASISGETTSGGLSRISKLLEQERPSIVFIELGANDALRGLTIHQTEANLRQMIQLSKRSGAKVLLFGMQIPPNYGQEYTKQFKEMFPRLAREQQIQLLPFFLDQVATQRELFQADGIHPNEQAQTQLYQNVWGSMAPYQTLLKKK